VRDKITVVGTEDRFLLIWLERGDGASGTGGVGVARVVWGWHGGYEATDGVKRVT
jgi:hypothetical protein